MSQNGNDQSHLRIGGWLPGSGPTPPAADQPVPGARHRPARADRPTTPSAPATAIAPSVRRPGGFDAGPPTAPGDQGAIMGRVAPRRTQLLGGVALIVVTVLVGVMTLRDGAPQEPIHGEFVAGMPLPDSATDDPVDGGPSGLDGTGSDVPGDGAASRDPSTDPVVRPGLNPRADGGTPADTGSGSTSPGDPPSQPAGHAPPAAPNAPAAPGSAPARPAGPALVPGARIGLEAANSAGHRVRHANFQARVEQVNATSSAGTKADAAFIVRSGLARSGCVSFESVNFPGHYLRHSEFRVFLHRADGSALFRADATFCPVTGIGGRHTSLRSHNFPDRYLSYHRSAQMRISPIGDGAGPSTATFRIRPAL
ncbi:hypothetical protein GCM10029963_31620 [Micromonospora andamanensis]|nr:hypothetical protein Vwe01_37500 [Micromonospora andamanensis]